MGIPINIKRKVKMNKKELIRKLMFSMIGPCLCISLLIGTLWVALCASQGSGSTSPSSQNFDWKNANYRRESIPGDIISGADSGDCYTINEGFQNVEGANVHFKESGPTSNGLPLSDQTILLLHGARFSSATWKDSIKTLQTLGCLGYKAVAIDLPGFGKTRRASLRGEEFLEAAILQFFPSNLRRPVVISPSMSGSFSLPLLVSRPDLFSGFVPVAPVSAGSYASQYINTQVPTMIVYGEFDSSAKFSNQQLSKLPNSSAPQELSRGNHPAYLDQPDDWHKLLYNFMLLLK